MKEYKFYIAILFLVCLVNSCGGLLQVPYYCESSTVEKRITECKKKYEPFFDFYNKYKGFYSITNVYINSVLSNDTLKKYNAQKLEIGGYYDDLCKRAGGSEADSYRECLNNEDVTNFKMIYINFLPKSTKIITDREILKINDNTYQLGINATDSLKNSFIDVLKIRRSNWIIWQFTQLNETEFIFENKDKSVKLTLRK